MIEVASMVLFSADATRTIAFYRALGVPLDVEDHGDGLLHAACDVGEVHVAILPSDESGAGSDDSRAGAPRMRASGSTFAGFYVQSLDAALGALVALGAPVLVDHQVREWGCRAVLEDPDGRAVEVNQRSHCPS